MCSDVEETDNFIVENDRVFQILKVHINIASYRYPALFYFCWFINYFL